MSNFETPTENYTYDAVGNRTASHLSANYSYQPFNKLTSTANATYSYDNNGNLLSKTGSSGTTTFSWNEENQLTQVTLPSSLAVNYKYDGLGRRIQRTTSSGANERYVYDGQDVLLDLNADWSVATTYLSGRGIDNHLRQTNSTTGVSYFLTDHLGSTSALIDASGNLVETESYDSFGNNGGSARTRYGYTGRERDPDTGAFYYRARFYDPQVGRFLSEDPMGFDAAVNWYAYVGDNPIRYIDSTGMEILTARQYEQPILPPPDAQERKRLAAFLNCVERNRFSSLFGGVPYVHGAAEFLEIGGPVSLMSDLAATGAKLAGKGVGDPQPYASGLNYAFRRGTELGGYPKIGGTPVRGILTGVGDVATPVLAVSGAFTFSYNATIEVECGCGVLK